MTKDSNVDASAQYRTPRRPGQPGEESQRRDGPSPRSGNPTGPHAPYEADDQAGLAADKHVGSGTPQAPDERTKKVMSDNISVLGEDE